MDARRSERTESRLKRAAAHALVRKRAGRAKAHELTASLKTRQTLAGDWQAWVLENLLEGAAPAEILAALVARGVPRATAAREITELKESGAFKHCRALQERVRQLHDRASVLTSLRKVSTQVERFPMLTSEEFFGRYYSSNTPVVLTELMKDWPALARWTPEYFRDVYGEVEVEIVEDRDKDPYCDRQHDAVKRKTTMAEYAERVRLAGKTNDFYFTARNRNIELEGLRGLQNDVIAPTEFFLPQPTKRSQSFWFGPEGSITATHHDPTNILFCQVYGRKLVQLAPPTDAGLLANAEGYYNRATGDLRSYPELAGSHVLDVTLEPGEALFIPALWWHRVEALSVSISFSLLHFKHSNRYPEYRP